MNYLILHTGPDQVATTVATHLDARHPGEVACLTLWDLQTAKRWSHHQQDGKTTNQLILANKARIDPTNAVVFNRLSGVTTPRFANANPVDRQYAAEETQALLLSWLRALPCPVINRATHAGLVGPYLDQLSWFMLANRAGLPTPAVSLTSSVRRFPRPHLVPVDAHYLGRLEATLGEPPSDQNLTVTIVGNQVIGTHPITLREPLKALARLANVEFLEVHLNRLAGNNPRWVFNGANTFPLSVSDETVLALLYLIESKSGANQ